MCVPEIYWDDCIQMKVDSSKKGIPISCISGRDRYECIDKVGRKEADLVAVDPEDMYLAAKHELAYRAQYNVVEQVFVNARSMNLWETLLGTLNRDLKGLRVSRVCFYG